ncbi:hypothetical protein K443DRAFT_677456 [Laccaria amethystina LaAM-08-1]|uniref:Uncharacterized protein n=1 Tax=Laccaria amethystina LaAM-08-1 TaxID=1095629 RepID=A0A0C9XM32_9AGAR|nr:hypothetical protein K443DRAFT_677456 [Laccaria amethystina LaAM-08-1]
MTRTSPHGQLDWNFSNAKCLSEIGLWRLSFNFAAHCGSKVREGFLPRRSEDFLHVTST